MGVKEVAGRMSRRTIEHAHLENLPKPLMDELIKNIDAIVQSTHLMLDKPSRYSTTVAETAIKLPKERITSLADKYGPRIKRIPFTIEGIPSKEEITLTCDLWEALKENERQTLLNNTTHLIFPEETRLLPEVPDETPYAMRLLHRYMQMHIRDK